MLHSTRLARTALPASTAQAEQEDEACRMQSARRGGAVGRSDLDLYSTAQTTAEEKETSRSMARLFRLRVIWPGSGKPSLYDILDPVGRSRLTDGLAGKLRCALGRPQYSEIGRYPTDLL